MAAPKEFSAETEVTDENLDGIMAQMREADNVPDEVQDEQEEQVAGEPEKETEKSADKGEEKDDERERFVPHQALHAERMKRKELQQQIEEIKQRNARMEQIFQERLAPKPAEPELPSLEDDPVSHLAERNRRLEAEIAKLSQHVQGREQQSQQSQQQQRAWQQMMNQYRESANEFTRETPDFGEAYKFYLDARRRDFEAAGYDQQQTAYGLQHEEAGLVAKALQDEVNPAARLYALAKARGYTKAQDDADKLRSIEKGTSAAKTLGSGSGKTKTEITLERLAELDGEEFDKAWAKLEQSGGFR